MQLSRDCPYCGAVEALIIFGARASSLLSVALGQTFASRHNDDHKVIAFSDNVQDAAHRAGFRRGADLAEQRAGGDRSGRGRTRRDQVVRADRRRG